MIPARTKSYDHWLMEKKDKIRPIMTNTCCYDTWGAGTNRRRIHSEIHPQVSTSKSTSFHIHSQTLVQSQKIIVVDIDVCVPLNKYPRTKPRFLIAEIRYPNYELVSTA